MKKLLLTLVIILCAGAAAYAVPTMQVMRGNIEGLVPTPFDQEIPYNAATGCYEGDFVLTGYNQLQAWQYVKFYLRDEDNNITYIGGPKDEMIATSMTAQTLPISQSANPDMVREFFVMYINGNKNYNSGVEHVSINLESNEATFELKSYDSQYGSLGLAVSFKYPDTEIMVRNCYLFPTPENMTFFEGYYDVPAEGAYVFIGSFPSGSAATVYEPEAFVDIVLSENQPYYSNTWKAKEGSYGYKPTWAKLSTPGLTKVTYDITTNQVTFTYVNDSNGEAPQPVEGALYIAYGSGMDTNVTPSVWDSYMEINEATGKYEGTITMKRGVSFKFYTGSSEDPTFYGVKGSTSPTSNEPVDFEDATSATGTVVEDGLGGFYISKWQYGIVNAAEIPVTFSVDLSSGNVDFSVEPFVPATFNVFQLKNNQFSWYDKIALHPVAGEPGLYSCFLDTFEPDFSFILSMSDTPSNYILGAYSADFKTNVGDGGEVDVTLERGASLVSAITLANKGDYNLIFNNNTRVLTIQCQKTYDTNTVEGIEAESGNTRIFNLQGVEVTGRELPRGIYIIGGKKVVL